MRDLLHKHFDKLLLVLVFLFVAACFIWDPKQDHAETYKPLLAGIAGAILTLVTKSSTQTPTTTTTTDGPGATETKTETKP